MLGEELVMVLGELDPLLDPVETPAGTSPLRGGVKIPAEGVNSAGSVVAFEPAEADAEAAKVVAAPAPEAPEDAEAWR